jgi:hypothetical protein
MFLNAKLSCVKHDCILYVILYARVEENSIFRQSESKCFIYCKACPIDKTERRFTWTKLILTPIVHTDSESAGDMVLQVRTLDHGSPQK